MIQAESYKGHNVDVCHGTERWPVRVLLDPKLSLSSPIGIVRTGRPVSGQSPSRPVSKATVTAILVASV